MRQADFIEGFPGTLVRIQEGVPGSIPDTLLVRLTVSDEVIVRVEQVGIAIQQLDPTTAVPAELDGTRGGVRSLSIEERLR